MTELSEAFHANETPEKLTAAICNKRACRGALGKARTRVLYGTKRVGTAGRLSTALTTVRWANQHEQRLLCHGLIARGRVPLEWYHATRNCTGSPGAGTEQVGCVRREGRELLSWFDGLIDLELLVVTHCREYCCCSILLCRKGSETAGLEAEGPAFHPPVRFAPSHPPASLPRGTACPGCSVCGQRTLEECR